MSKRSKFPNAKVYEMQAQLCGALAHPVRLRILDVIGGGEMSSAELLEVLDLPKANLSQHLTVLKDAGILKSRREGLYQYLSMALPRVREACAMIKTVLREKIERHEKLHSEVKKELRSHR